MGASAKPEKQKFWHLGGSATGLSTLAIITFTTLTVRNFGVTPLIYTIYGLISLPSHLYVHDYHYVLTLLLLIVIEFCEVQ